MCCRALANAEQSIGECQDNIGKAREELKSAIQIRRNRQQYDSLARIIQHHPDRVHTQEEIGTLQQELDQLTQTRDGLIGKVCVVGAVLQSACSGVCMSAAPLMSSLSPPPLQLELRKRQFHLLVHSIHELQQLLDEEHNEGGGADGEEDMEVT